MSDLRCSRKELLGTHLMRSAALRGELPAASAHTVRHPRRLRPYRTRRYRGAIPPEPPPPTRQYVKLTMQVARDHALVDGAKVCFQWLAALGGATGRLDTFVSSLAKLCERCVRTILRYLAALEARGYIVRLRDPVTGKLRIWIDPGCIPPRPHPPQVEIIRRALRSKNAAVLDVAQAAIRRVSEAMRCTGQGAVTFLSPIKSTSYSESRAAGRSGPTPACRSCSSGGWG